MGRKWSRRAGGAACFVRFRSVRGGFVNTRLLFIVSFRIFFYNISIMSEQRESKELCHWADQMAARIIKERGDLPLYTCASGITPSGTVHIGNFREIITVDLVVRALRARGAAYHQMTEALDQKTFLMSGSAAAFSQYGEIRRIQEHQVKRLAADPAVEETAHSNAM